MIIEYAGTADRWSGPGVVHEVRAWWNAITDSHGAVKSAAVAAVKAEVAKSCHVEVSHMDADTSTHPTLNALVRVRVLTSLQVAERAELRTRRYTRCDTDGCENEPGQLVRMKAGGAERVLCFGCWHAVRTEGTVLHWIQSGGKLQL